MPEYINPNNYTVHLIGPDGKSIRVKAKQHVVLSEHFERYCARGFLKPAKQSDPETRITQPRIQIKRRAIVKQPEATQTIQNIDKHKRSKISRARKIAMSHKLVRKQNSRQIVGRTLNSDANNLLKTNLAHNNYPISNNIGIGILSYNRPDSLRRLVSSIIATTDLRRTTVFISDDASTDHELQSYLNELSTNHNFIVIQNKQRLGIAGNSNRLLRCLSRFKYGILLNDDVEVLNNNWDTFYPTAIQKTGMHHFIYRQPGVYGAEYGELLQQEGVNLLKVMERPHGAVLAFDNVYLNKVGYFDENYGLYGMEHVDWSQRAWEMGLQKPGFYDVAGSEALFKLHADVSAIPNQNRHNLLQEARRTFSRRRIEYIKPTDSTRVSEITYIIPFRNFERTDSILTVVNNIRAQRFPVINILIVEHDNATKINLDEYQPISYFKADASDGNLFNKSRAFNLGVSKAPDEIVVFHDADMLAQGHYTQAIVDALDKHDSCHLGKSVMYTTNESMQSINESGIVDHSANCERVVGYYEGGSLACKKKAFWSVGGFNEDYKGYGCFTPGNYVLTNSGYKTIESVEKDDLLYTHECEFKRIELRTRKYGGTILDIYIPGRLPIKGVTPNHPFLVKTNDNEFMWRRADRLNKGDIVASTDFLPEFVQSYDLHDLVDLDQSKNSFDVFLKMEQFCYLLGLYLADGVLQTPDRLRTVYYYLNQTEEFIAQHVEKLVHELHPDIYVAYHYVKNNCREVRVFNSLLAKTIKAIAGRHQAIDKVISPSFVNSLNDNQLSFLLGGACDGDANHGNGSEKRHTYHTSSINLAMAYSGIMRRLGIAHSFGKRNGGSFLGSSEWTFDLCVNREFEHLIRTVYSKPPCFGSNSVGKSKFGTVYDIKDRHYNGPVYNFEVHDDHSYVVNGLIVHNCEDCDFYARLSNGSQWKEDRVFDFLHLWHSRADGWNNHHETNKLLETKLRSKSINDRIRLQHNQLRKLGYGKQLEEAL